MIAYVMTQGARVVREGQRLLVLKEGDTYNTLFIWKLEQVVFFGNVSLTPPALYLLFKENIDTVFLRKDGRYIGRLANTEPKNVALRKRQFSLLDDQEFRLKLAGSIVRGKLANQATLLARIKRARSSDQAGLLAKEIRSLADQAEMAQGIDSLLGIEGAASAKFFTGLRLGFNKDWGFAKRVRRPPTDPVNAVLSLIYTLLINRCYSAVRLANLDPQPGALHEVDYGRHALPLDLVEEFRSLVAEPLTLSLFNLGVLNKEDFVIQTPEEDFQEGNSSEEIMDSLISKAVGDSLGSISDLDKSEVTDLEGQQLPPLNGKMDKRPVMLTPAALKRVLAAFSKKIDTEFLHPVAEKRMSYAQAMYYQAQMYREVIEGTRKDYQPLQLK